MNVHLISRYTINFKSNDKVPFAVHWKQCLLVMAPCELSLINSSSRNVLAETDLGKLSLFVIRTRKRDTIRT